MNRGTQTDKIVRGAVVVLLAGLFFGPKIVQGLSLVLLVVGAVLLNSKNVGALRSSVRVTLRTTGTARAEPPANPTAPAAVPAARAQLPTAPPAAAPVQRPSARPPAGESDISPDAVSEQVFGKRD